MVSIVGNEKEKTSMYHKRRVSSETVFVHTVLVGVLLLGVWWLVRSCTDTIRMRSMLQSSETEARRVAAVKQLTDQDALTRIALDADEMSSVRYTAAKRVFATPALRTIALAGEYRESLVALSRLTTQEDFYAIAKDAVNYSTRTAASHMLQIAAEADRDALLYFATADMCAWPCRLYAYKRFSGLETRLFNFRPLVHQLMDVAGVDEIDGVVNDDMLAALMMDDVLDTSSRGILEYDSSPAQIASNRAAVFAPFVDLERLTAQHVLMRVASAYPSETERQSATQKLSQEAMTGKTLCDMRAKVGDYNFWEQHRQEIAGALRSINDRQVLEGVVVDIGPRLIDPLALLPDIDQMVFAHMYLSLIDTDSNWHAALSSVGERMTEALPLAVVAHLADGWEYRKLGPRSLHTAVLVRAALLHPTILRKWKDIHVQYETYSRSGEYTGVSPEYQKKSQIAGNPIPSSHETREGSRIVVSCGGHQIAMVDAPPVIAFRNVDCKDGDYIMPDEVMAQLISTNQFSLDDITQLFTTGTPLMRRYIAEHCEGLNLQMGAREDTNSGVARAAFGKLTVEEQKAVIFSCEGDRAVLFVNKNYLRDDKELVRAIAEEHPSASVREACILEDLVKDEAVLKRLAKTDPSREVRHYARQRLH